MKVLSLRCAQEHRFEGWFASDDAYVSQCERGLVACPLCGDTQVSRLPSAPRLNLAARGSEALTLPTPTDVQTAWMHAVRQVMERTEDVGERFAEEARRIHYGEVQERSIRGSASSDDAQALADEGIDVMALPVPAVLKGPLQ